MWDCRDRRLITSVQGPRAAVAAVRIDDERLVASTHDGSITMWDYASVDAAHIRKVGTHLGRHSAETKPKTDGSVIERGLRGPGDWASRRESAAQLEPC